MSKISIILPTYNVEKYIARALESCINQSFKDIEIIIVDDCGSDKSIEIAKEYASNDKRISILHNKENLGLLKARYEGVKVATSPYIMFLDPDDYLELNACEQCATLLNNELDFIWFNFIYDTCDGIKKDIFLEDNLFSINNYCKYILNKKNTCHWNLCSKIIKVDIYKKAFIYTENLNIRLTMAEDALIYFFIILNCKKIATSSLHIYHYYQNYESSTNTNDIIKIQKNLDDEKEVINFLSSYLKYNKHISKNILIFLKTIIIQLKINRLNRKIKYDRLKYCYVVYKYKKIINKQILQKYYKFVNFLVLKNIQK
ncbi:glycosyltransferase family 2 protein [Campylobacter peloridis]|uniref:Glycosyltransferase family 2 protein n=1 Tax=Campylobacter peloridis TaxID=488546 RepID=A0ABX6TVF7_9BACT|nr:glycosyltransferase family 2 protein [Campylobacter peloridis]AJC85158.1 glycosyltransferase, family 2 [Campylobacter peloridis LMG 23910]QOQ89184.1 glycosyltransferase family 2 protein [Campylobacter peloridis]